MTLPALAVRGVLAGACIVLLACVAAAAPDGGLTLRSFVLGAALVAWVVAVPGSAATTVLLLLALTIMIGGDQAAWALVALQAASLSAVHLLASMCALTPLDARWERAALVPTARRWLVAQAISLPLLALAWSVPRGQGGTVLGVVTGATAVALVAWLVRLTRRSVRRGAAQVQSGEDRARTRWS